MCLALYSFVPYGGHVLFFGRTTKGLMILFGVF